MNKKFLSVKLNRAIWISLLNSQNTEEGIKEFKLYKKNLKAFPFNILYRKEIKQELASSNNIFIDKLSKSAETYIKDKNYKDALICYKTIYETNNQKADNLYKYIECLLNNVEQYDIALELCKYLVKINPTDNNYKMLAKLYDKNCDLYSALDAYGKYMKLSNKQEYDGNDNTILGCYYYNHYANKQIDPEIAEKCFNHFYEALKNDFNNKAYLKNTIIAAGKAKKYEIEKKCWKLYFKLGYGNKEDEFTYSASALKNCDLEEYYKYYDSRFEKDKPTPYPTISKPKWNGTEELSDSTLLIHFEQGYGDNFLMWGYVPRLTKLAKHVIYVIQDGSYELLKNNDIGVEVIARKDAKLNEMQYDYHLPSMSIPVALKLSKEELNVGGGYIKADPQLSEKFRNKYFKNNKLKIGISFVGVEVIKKRNIPEDKLAILDKLNNVEFYCLNKNISDKQLSGFKHNKVINAGNDFANFAETAAAIDNMDIIVTSDNCILNLAGAMGKKTLGIFNHDYEFRWYDLTGENCGYFNSVIPIVNDGYDNWDKSMDKAIEIIKSEFADKI